MKSITVEVDLAKQVFALCEVDANGSIQQRRELRRGAFHEWIMQQLPGTIVAMEACSGAHYWGRA